MPNTKRMDGYAYNRAGTPLVGLTVNIYREDTGALVGSTTTLDANLPVHGAGYWVVNNLPTEQRHRAEIVLNAQQKLVRAPFSGEVAHLTVRENAYFPAMTASFFNNVALSTTLATYLPLAGGTISGNLTITGTLIPSVAQLPNGTTINGQVAWHAGNDGPGSTLHADLLDGLHASAFATSGHLHDDRYSQLGHTHNYTRRVYINTPDIIAFSAAANVTETLDVTTKGVPANALAVIIRGSYSLQGSGTHFRVFRNGGNTEMGLYGPSSAGAWWPIFGEVPMLGGDFLSFFGNGAWQFSGVILGYVV